MGNTSIKETFSLFHNIKQDIIVKNNRDTVYSNKQAIANKLYYNENNFQSINSVEINCKKYDIYTNRLIPNLVNHGNTFILTHQNNQFHFSFISDGAVELLDLNRDYLIHNINVFFTLFYPTDKIIFDREFQNTIKNRNTKWKWIGKIKVNNIYLWFQMDSTIEYYRNYINIYSTLTNVSLMADLYQQQYDKLIIDSCISSKYGIPSNIPTNIKLEKGPKSINIKTILENYISNYSINDYHIDIEPEYIIYDKQLLSNILDGFFIEKIQSFIAKISRYNIEFSFWYSNDFQPSNKVIDLIIKYNGHYIYKSNNHYIIKLPYIEDYLTDIRPSSLTTYTNKYDKTNNIILIDHNIAHKNYIDKFLTHNGFNVISNNNFNNVNKQDDVIIYNTTKDFTIDKIRKLGYHNPVIISNNYDDNGYNYKLDYPFNENILLTILTEIYTKIKILYIDNNLNNIALNTSILEKKLKYNLDIHNDLSIFSDTDSLEKYQLIIIDDSITNKEYHYLSKLNLISLISIPILYMCDEKNRHNSFFTNKLVKPFSIDTLQKTIIETL